jgi:hypothetical protein
MARRVSIREKRREAPEWIFRWRPLGDPVLPKWLAFTAVTMAFVFLVASVRIRVTPPPSSMARKAALILTGDDAESRALAQKAAEGGPFPTRFDLTEWENSAETSALIASALRWTPPVYQPKLLDLPAGAASPVKLAAAGEPVFPKRSMPPAEPPPLVVRQVPVLSPLSAGASRWMPRELPEFSDPVPAGSIGKPLRFLLRLDPSGRVLDAQPLVDLENDMPSPLPWLRRVTFAPEPNKPSRWIAVDLSFANQAADGPDAR